MTTGCYPRQLHTNLIFVYIIYIYNFLNTLKCFAAIRRRQQMHKHRKGGNSLAAGKVMHGSGGEDDVQKIGGGQVEHGSQCLAGHAGHKSGAAETYFSFKQDNSPKKPVEDGEEVAQGVHAPTVAIDGGNG
jgi:hypothetical protein